MDPLKPCPCGDDRPQVVMVAGRTRKPYRAACTIPGCWEGPFSFTQGGAAVAWNERE